MDKILGLAKEIEEKINNLPEAREYLRLKELIECDEEIQNLQKQIISRFNENKNDEANLLLSRLNENPIVANFNLIKSELHDTLKTITEILK